MAAGKSCTFSVNGTATPMSSVLFRLNYSGTTCLGPLQGENVLSLAAHSAPTAFSISGALTDGTSGGVLPNIEASASGVAVRSDAGGHYELPGVPAGPPSDDAGLATRAYLVVRQGEAAQVIVGGLLGVGIGLIITG